MYTTKNTAANSLAMESNDSAEAAKGDAATLTKAAAPASLNAKPRWPRAFATARSRQKSVFSSSSLSSMRSKRL